MDDNLIEYKVGEQERRLDVHEMILEEHDKRINATSMSLQRLADSIDNLSKNVEKGFGMMKWFIGLFVGGLMGLFFFIIQSMI